MDVWRFPLSRLLYVEYLRYALIGRDTFALSIKTKQP